MSSNKKQSGFLAWYNSPGGQRLVGAVYSIGAAIVIVGALFKIMHWPFAGLLLSAGMITEAVLFAIGIFEKPHKTYHWENVFSFDGEGISLREVGTAGVGGNVQTTDAVGQTMAKPAKLAEAEVISLSEGIKNLSETAQQLTSLSTAIGSAKEFAKNVESASDATAKFATTQDSLSSATQKLFSSYESLQSDMNTVVGGTKQYAEKVDGINKNLSSLNSVYEIQLKAIQSQAEAINKQNDAIQQQSQAISSQVETTRTITESLNEVAGEHKKMKQTTTVALEEINKYKTSSAELANQIAELNKVYGNMLNALS